MPLAHPLSACVLTVLVWVAAVVVAVAAAPLRSGPGDGCLTVALLIGYARCSTDEQDLTAQRDGPLSLGVAPARRSVDHDLTGINRDRLGLWEALSACRESDTLEVTKLDRSLPDAPTTADELTARQVRLSIGASVYDPTDPVGRLLVNALTMVAEFEAVLIRFRTREKMELAKAIGHLRGRMPQLTVGGGASGAPAGRWCAQHR